MVLSYYGFSCFKIQSGESVIAIDPFGKADGIKPPRFEAGYAIFTDQNDKQKHCLAGSPVVFSTPGEYDINGFTIIGFETEENKTPFFIELDGIRILHAGNTYKASSMEQIVEHIGTIDILLVSAPGSVNEASKIIKLIGPRIIIPMYGHATKKSFVALIKELGEKHEAMDKLSIKRKALPQEGQRIITLKPMV